MNLSEILQKKWDNIPLSKEESAFLSQHISTVEGEAEFDAQLLNFWDGFEAGEDSFDEEVVLGRIRQKIGTEVLLVRRINKFSGLRRLWPYTAAAIALIVGVFFGLSRLDKQQTPEVIYTTQNKVELITADGEKIMLDDTEALPEGFKRGNVTQDGLELVYSDTETTNPNTVPSFNTLRVPKGETYSMLLPDGTKVYLNAMTTLRFPDKFNARSREIYLSGEAAFEVKANKESPFLVHTDTRIVQVTGTRFNVSSYADDAIWRTSLFEGKVSILGGKQDVHMLPNQYYGLHKASGETWVKPFEKDEELFAGWMDNEMQFNATELKDIVRQLQRWYDFTVTYQDASLSSKRFTAAIRKNEPLNAFFDIIEQTTDIEISIQSNKVIIGKKNEK